MFIYVRERTLWYSTRTLPDDYLQATNILVKVGTSKRTITGDDMICGQIQNNLNICSHWQYLLVTDCRAISFLCVNSNSW